ncbi:MAG TPA: glycerophosphodiester phosphodiesterase [Steroidobacteraceae bacterium]|jgi:glycerophosphoryl diester phosphodiesterase|nr:glycerophosphodiester phosphodiesterase [Steroidobacteraceae bacterium]
MPVALLNSVRSPIVIAHRGASGYAPEHTLVSYLTAIEQGADYIEPDLVMTRDGVMVARHENEIGGTTDVAGRREFADRHATKIIDGVSVTGWFTEDFLLAELKTLRARERIPELRPANTRLDGSLEIPTLEEILALVRGAQERRRARASELGLPAPQPVGVYPETKHPSYFAALGLAMEEPLVAALERYDYRGRDGHAFLQSFETGNLQALSRMTRLPLVQLIEAAGAPFDLRQSGDPRGYADLLMPKGLEEVSAYASCIGPAKSLLIPRGADGSLMRPTSLVRDCHAAGLQVHPWTFRAERAFLPTGLDLERELGEFLALGMDGFFTDQPDVGVRARDAFTARPPHTG